MTLDQVAIGGTYRLHAQEVGHPTVIVEEITVDDPCTPGGYTLTAALRHALVWVYEAARNTRYPTNPVHLGRLPQ